MDPLSVAASVVGLIAAGAQLIPQLYNLSSAIKDAPQQARAAVSELGDITIVLTQLQKYIDGRAQASIQRLNLITVEHITASSTESVMTYSELDAILKALHANQKLKVWDRAIWFVKKDEVGQIIVRLQNHKSTFGLVLNTIQCASMNEAEGNKDRLCDMVNELLQSNTGLWLKLWNMEDTISRHGLGPGNTTGDSQQASAGANAPSPPSLEPNSPKVSSRSASIDSGGAATSQPRTSADLAEEPHGKASAFEELLHRSRVYRHAAGRYSETSLVDDGRSSLAISRCSSMTLGEVSKISVYALPVYADELSNPECYEFKRLSPVTYGLDIEASRAHQQKSSDAGHSPGKPKEEEQSLRPRRRWRFSRRPKEARSGLSSEEPVQHISGVELNTSVRYANVAISLYNEEGESYIYGYLPIIVAKCGVFLKEKGTDVQGIFEKASSPKSLQELRVIFDSPPRYGNGLAWDNYTVFDAANILLRYLLQLPEPVIPTEIYERFIAPLQQEPLDYDLAVGTFQSLITELQPLNRQLLLYVLDLLAVLASKSVLNSMTTAKLAALFQPGILHHPALGLGLAELRSSQDTLVLLIDNQDHWLVGMQVLSTTMTLADGSVLSPVKVLTPSS